MSGSRSKRVFVDANVFLRVFVGRNESQKQGSKAFIRAVEDGKIPAVTLSVVTAEVQWVAKSTYELPKEDGVEMLERLVETPGLDIVSETDMGAALGLYRQHNVKFIDCLIGAYVLNAEMPIVSYDTDFDTLDCERIEPKEVVE